MALLVWAVLITAFSAWNGYLAVNGSALCAVALVIAVPMSILLGYLHGQLNNVR